MGHNDLFLVLINIDKIILILYNQETTENVFTNGGKRLYVIQKRLKTARLFITKFRNELKRFDDLFHQSLSFLNVYKRYSLFL